MTLANWIGMSIMLAVTVLIVVLVIRDYWDQDDDT